MFAIVRNRWTFKQIAVAALAIAFVAFAAFERLLFAPTPGVEVKGIVVSSGSATYARQTRSLVTVRLATGQTVLAEIVSGGPPAPGTQVTVLERVDLLGLHSYDAIVSTP